MKKIDLWIVRAYIRTRPELFVCSRELWVVATTEFQVLAKLPQPLA